MPPPQQQNQSDNSLGLFWIVIGLFCLLWAVWYFWHAKIAEAILDIKFWEMKAISVFFFTNAMDNVMNAISMAQPQTITFNGLIGLSNIVGSYMTYPVFAIICILAMVLYMDDATLKYRRTYTMSSLAKLEAVNWPEIYSVIDTDLLKEDLNKGPWAMAMSPMQFARNNNLLIEKKEYVPDPKGTFQRLRTVVSLDKEKAHKVFYMQMGEYWTGYDDLSDYMKALFAIFAARIAENRDVADEYLREIDATAKKLKPDFSKAEGLLHKYASNKKVQKIISEHSFVMGVMAEMLDVARKDGVLPCSNFLWLKPMDRKLWFMLCSIGRQVPFCEVAAPFGHWLAERRIEHRLVIPVIDGAINGLEKAIQDVIYIPESSDQ